MRKQILKNKIPFIPMTQISPFYNSQMRHFAYGSNAEEGGNTNSYQKGGYNKQYNKGGYNNKEGGANQSYGAASTTSNLQYNNKRIYLRGYNVVKTDVMMNV